MIREGDYYRLSDPFQEEVAAWMSVAKDQSQALVSVVRLSAEGNPFGTYVKLKGLDAESFYLEETTGHVYSGMTLMQAGLLLPMAAAEYEAYQFSFKKMKEAADLYDVLRNKISAERNVISIFGGSVPEKRPWQTFYSNIFWKTVSAVSSCMEMIIHTEFRK